MAKVGESAVKTPEWRVIRILNEYRVVVNAPIGSVEVGDKLQVYRNTSVITDPETQKELGILPDVLATVEVVQIEELFCVAESAEVTVVGPIAESWLRLAAQMSMPALVRSERQMLPVRPEDIDRPAMAARERLIRVGDKVRKLPQVKTEAKK